VSISDQQLINRVLKKQDQHAFAQLVLRHQSSLRRWTRRLCVDEPNLADDLAQEVFLKAYIALASYRAEAAFSTWLFRIAFNLAAQRWRQKKHHWADEAEEQDVLNPNCDYARWEAKKDISAALKYLSPAQQLAIGLCFEEGLSHEEAALIMHIPLGTLKTHVNRGKQKLQHLLSAWAGASS
jgi:RNA polymerase sigma-70 factor (ECF subfamily)